MAYKPTGNPTGRPCTYDEDAVSRILEDMANGHSIFASALAHGIPPATFRNWAQTDRNGLLVRYNRARGAGLLKLEDQANDPESQNHQARSAQFFLERMNDDLRPPKQNVDVAANNGPLRITIVDDTGPDHEGEDGPDASAT